MLNFNFDISKILAGLDGIKQQVNEAVRPAAQAGAQVFYNEVKLRATRGDKTRNLKSGKTRPAGLLASSIYEVFSKDNSNQNHATYHVSWNKKKAPHGYLVEYGTSRAPAHPFLRPAFDSVHGTAEAAVINELEKRMKGKL